MFHRCLSVCLFDKTNVRKYLQEIAREGWQWANEQMIKLCWLSEYGSGSVSRHW